jgi:hypothetical protein
MPLNLTRHYKYVNGEPHMLIGKGYMHYAIPLQNAWVFRIYPGQPVYPNEMEALVYDDRMIPRDPTTQKAMAIVNFACTQICNILGIKPTIQNTAIITSFIEDGIEDLIKMKPAPEEQKKIIGEGKTTIGGVTHHFPIHEGDFSE